MSTQSYRAQRNTQRCHNIVLTARASLCRHTLRLVSLTMPRNETNNVWRHYTTPTVCYHQHYNTTSRSLHSLLCQIQATRFITGYKRHLAVQSLFHLISKNRTINYSYTARGATKLPTFAKRSPLLDSNATLCRQVGHDELLMTQDSRQSVVLSAFRMQRGREGNLCS